MKERIKNLIARVKTLKPAEGKEFTDYLDDTVKEIFEEMADKCLKSPEMTATVIAQQALEKEDPDLLKPIENALLFVDSK